MVETCNNKLKYISFNLQAQLLAGCFDTFNIHKYKRKAATVKQSVRHLKSVKVQTCIRGVFVHLWSPLAVKLEDGARLRSEKRGGLKRENSLKLKVKGKIVLASHRGVHMHTFVRKCEKC